MIKNNIIYFGYGTVAVGCNALQNTLTFQAIKPSVELGLKITKEIGEKLEWGITIEIDDMYFNSDIMKQLLNIKNQNNKQIKIDKYILDFNNYSEKSIQVITEHLEALRAWTLRCLAC